MRRTLATTAVAAVVATAATTAAGCSAVDTALGCANTAVTVAESVDDLQQAVSSASEDPTQARQALDRIDTNLDDLENSTDNADLGRAVDNLQQSVTDVRQDLDAGRTPDTSGMGDAADELTSVCSPG